MFIGYPNKVKGYKIWCIERKKCVISRDVIYNEKDLNSKINKIAEVINHNKDKDIMRSKWSLDRVKFFNTTKLILMINLLIVIWV